MKVIQVWIDKGSGFRQMLFDGTEEDKRKIMELVKQGLEKGCRRWGESRNYDFCKI